MRGKKKMDDIVQDFIIESYENLNQLDHDLIALEKQSHTRETLDRIFRNFHTIKGTCGFFGFSKLQAITHAGENILSLLREGIIKLESDLITALLLVVDSIRNILASVEKFGHEGEQEYHDLLQLLQELQSEKSESSAEEDTEILPENNEKHDSFIAEKIFESEEITKAFHFKKTFETSLEPPSSKTKKLIASKPSAIDSKLFERDDSYTELSEFFIRVDVRALDRLMNLVGELVLARNQIAPYTEILTETQFIKTYQHLNGITSGLQEGVMKMRMQPIKSIVTKLVRIARDISNGCRKKVRFDVQGQDTELDKTVIESIKDPLVHLIRNAIDHGIESPEERRKKGKSEEATLALSAFHEGGQIHIHISDDGRGVDLEKIKELALSKNLIESEYAKKMTPSEILDILFLPGFSSSDQVTEISGRGVGLDVVKTNIEKIGGVIEILSQKEKGTTFKIKIPLTLTIIPALLISCQNHFFAIPQSSILEVIRVEKSQIPTMIEKIEDFSIYRLRGQLIPVLYLEETLQIPSTIDFPEMYLLIFQVENYRFGIGVNEIQDTQEIVVKKLGQQVKNIPCFGGVTILGNGEIALILDILGIAQHSGIISKMRSYLMSSSPTIVSSTLKEEQIIRKKILLVQIGHTGLLGIFLSRIVRLEEISKNSIEKRFNQQDVIQYRSRIIPLLYLDQLLQKTSPKTSSSDFLLTVICSYQEYYVGIVVDKIIDILEEEIDFSETFCEKENVKPIVFNNKVVDLVNLEKMIHQYIPNLSDFTQLESTIH